MRRKHPVQAAQGHARIVRGFRIGHLGSSACGQPVRLPQHGGFHVLRGAWADGHLLGGPLRFLFPNGAFLRHVEHGRFGLPRPMVMRRCVAGTGTSCLKTTSSLGKKRCLSAPSTM
jgi:hypothetical protein